MSCSQRRREAEFLREISWTRTYGLAAAPTVGLPEITIPEAARRGEAARPRVSEMHLTRGWVNLGPQSRSSAYTPAAADKGHVENNTDGEKLRVHQPSFPVLPQRPHSRRSAPDPDSRSNPPLQGARFGHVPWSAQSEVPNESNPSAYSCQHPQIVAGHLIEMRGVCGGGGGAEENTLQAALKKEF
ncbi:hypothetical protein BDZ89DRAFT_1086874 [Hymenopellis radicata]|nr:hypothetical protein BDZ89DRAFT_1086874 [Hymenopellis radicata]